MLYNQAKVNILGYVYINGPVTAKMIASFRSTSISCASTQLGNYYKWGLLERYKEKGKTFHYFITEEGVKRYRYLLKHPYIKPKIQPKTPLTHHHRDQKKSPKRKREWHEIERCPVTSPAPLPDHSEDMGSEFFIDPSRILYMSEPLDVSNLVKLLRRSH